MENAGRVLELREVENAGRVLELREVRRTVWLEFTLLNTREDKVVQREPQGSAKGPLKLFNSVLIRACVGSVYWSVGGRVPLPMRRNEVTSNSRGTAWSIQKHFNSLMWDN